MRALALVAVAGAAMLGLPGAAPAGDGFFGVAPQISPSTADLARMRAGGVESLRMPVDWGSISPAEGSIDLRALDAAVTEAARAGLRVLPTVYGAPLWLDPDFRVMPHTKDGLELWNGMLADLVRRYGRDGTLWAGNPGMPRLPITTWQIWNEANFTWFAQPVSPERYARLVVESARTIRRADPSAQVLLSGLYPSPRVGKGIESARFLDGLYGHPGFRAAFDEAAVHPYRRTVPETVEAIARIRDTLDEHGDRAKEIEVTELGWGSDSVDVFGTGSEQAQARRLTEAYDAILGARDALRVRSVYWFTWQDVPGEVASCYFCHGTGLFDAAGRAKPAWAAMKEVIAGTQPVRGTGSGTDSGPDPAPSGGKPRFGRIVVSPRRRPVRKGRGTWFAVRIENVGTAGALGVRVCARARSIRKGRCAGLGGIGPGRSKTVPLRVVARRDAPGHRAVVRFAVSGRGLARRTAKATLRLR